MLEDVEAHRPTEIELITGALVREGRAARRARAAPHGPVPARQGEGGVVAGGRMRVCIVGCGAVGSLFAANLGTLDDVEVWAYDLDARPRRRDQPRRAAADRLRRGRREGARDRRRRRAARRATSGSSRRRRCTPTRAIAATAHAFADGCVATVQNGIGNEEVLARHVERVIRGTTFPAGKVVAPGVVQWDVQGRHDARPVRAAARARRPRSSGSPTPARAPACRRTRSRTRAARSGAR